MPAVQALRSCLDKSLATNWRRAKRSQRCRSIPHEIGHGSRLLASNATRGGIDCRQPAAASIAKRRFPRFAEAPCRRRSRSPALARSRAWAHRESGSATPRREGRWCRAPIATVGMAGLVATSAERAIAGAAQDNDAYRLVPARVRYGIDRLLHRACAEGVHHRRSVDGDAGDAVALLGQDVFAVRGSDSAREIKARAGRHQERRREPRSLRRVRPLRSSAEGRRSPRCSDRRHARLVAEVRRRTLS